MTAAQNTTEDTLAQLHAVLLDLAALVDGVADADRRRPTPCTDYDVAALLDHVVGWLTTFADGYADPDGRAPRADLTGYHAPADTGGAIRAAAATLDAALAGGAASRPLALGEASMPGELALSMILWEYQVHGWDLAAAVGRSWSPDTAGLTASLIFAPMMLTEDYQGEGKSFGPRVAVADDAPELDRLVAVSGRDPLWVPPGQQGPAFAYIGSIRTHPGRRDEFVTTLTAARPGTAVGCTAYVVATDPADPDLVWVSETWLSARHHAASLRTPETRAAIEKAMPLLTGEFTGRGLDVRG